MMMKKLLAFALIAILAIAAWASIADYDNVIVHFGDEEFEGPLATLIGMIAASGGIVIAAIAVTCAAVFVGFLFAGLGILMVIGLGLLAVVLAAVIAPFLLPLLIPIGIIWWIAKRNKERKQAPALEQPV